MDGESGESEIDDVDGESRESEIDDVDGKSGESEDSDEEGAARKIRLLRAKRWGRERSRDRYYLDEEGVIRDRDKETEHQIDLAEDTTVEMGPPTRNTQSCEEAGDPEQSEVIVVGELNRNHEQAEARAAGDRSTAQSVAGADRDVNRNHENDQARAAGEVNRNAGQSVAGADRDVNRNHEVDGATVNLSDESIKKVALMVAQHMKIGNSDEGEEETECYIEGDDYVICRPCVKFCHDPNVPRRFHNKRVGHYGTFSRNQKKWHLDQALSEHLCKGLHQWCINREQEQAIAEAKMKEENESAGKEVIWKILHLLKHGGSSEDFVTMNGKSFIVPVLQFFP